MTQFYIVCFALFSLLVLLGCATDPDIDSKTVFVSSADVLPDDTQLWGEVTFADPTRNAWGTDDYVVNNPPAITGDVLTLNVSYSGGCEAHEFTLSHRAYFWSRILSNSRQFSPITPTEIAAKHG